MKKCKLAAMAWLSVCIVLFTSCGNSAGVSAGSTSEVKSTAVSESTAEEKQPYEIPVSYTHLTLPTKRIV